MIRFGICAKFDKLNDIIKAGFDYIEPSLSYIAAMSDEEFAEAEKLIAASPLKAEAYNSFFPSSIKVVGENVDTDAITAYMEKAFSRASRLGGKIAVLGSGKSRNIPEGYPYESAYRQFCEVFDLCATIAGKYGVITIRQLTNKGICIRKFRCCYNLFMCRI